MPKYDLSHTEIVGHGSVGRWRDSVVVVAGTDIKIHAKWDINSF